MARIPVRPLVSHPVDPTLMLVPLTRGFWAVIDAADAIAVGRYNWHAQTFRHTTYAANKTGPAGTQRLYLHRFVATLMGIVDDAPEIDHRDGNGLNCKRSNLRPATRSQQTANVARRSDNTSGARGVSWCRKSSRWRARINVDGREIYLGVYKEKHDAAVAVESAARKAWGEFSTRRGQSIGNS